MLSSRRWAGPSARRSPIVETRSYDEVRQLMIDDAGPNEAIVEQLPTFAQLQTTLPDQTYIVNPTMSTRPGQPAGVGRGSRSQLTSQPSAFDPLTPIDGTLEFGTDATFDFDPSDGITPGRSILCLWRRTRSATCWVLSARWTTLTRESETSSSTRSTCSGLRRARARSISPTARACSTRPRRSTCSSTAASSIVPDITVPPLTLGDIPLSRGVVNGDGYQASHWKDETLMLGRCGRDRHHGPDCYSRASQSQSRSPIARAFDLIGYNAVSRGSPADWRSIKLDQYSNDRNAATVTERESGEQNGHAANRRNRSGSVGPRRRI